MMYSILARVKSLFIDWKTGQWFSAGDRVIIILIVDVSVLLEVVIVLIMNSINDLQCKLIVRC